MCEAVLYNYRGQLCKSFFANPNAKLPVIASFDRIKLIPWGRRQLEASSFPVGSTLLREDILEGKYDLFFPKAVKLPILKFLEKDRKNISHWYEVIKGLFMQGLLANNGNEYRVYIVTIKPIMPHTDYNFWPRLLYDPSLELNINPIL